MDITIVPNWTDVRKRTIKTFPTVLIVGLVAFVLLLIAYATGKFTGVPLSNLTRDPDQIAHLPFYTGLISFLGGMMWSAAAGCILIGAFILRGSSPRKSYFLMYAGLLTVWLNLDDMLQFHEEAFPKFLNISEIPVFSLYLILLGVFLIYYLRDILSNTEFPILAISLFFMAISIFIDQVVDHVFVEDSFKFLGIAFWLTYFSRTAFFFIKESTRPIEQANT